MIRDNRKSKEYFDEYIDEEIEDFMEFFEMLDDGSVPDDRMDLLYQVLFEKKLDIIIAMYSRGDALSKIELEFNKLVELWAGVVCTEDLEVEYTQNLWVVSMAVLFGWADEKLAMIKDRFVEENINDWFFNFLLSDEGSNPELIEGELHEPERYQTLKKAICTSNKQLLVQYLEKEWYGHFKDYGWYDSHKLTRKSQSIYFGYWCFEVAAVMKKLGWNDSELIEQSYYPYDFAHYR